jgi:hypothetical protein
MKFFIFVLVFVQFLSASEIPTLRFDDKITWKQIFDYGFRPKHLEGLERNTCVVLNQSFWLEFKGRESKFKIDNGRLSFSFYHDDFLSMIWHQGAEAITLDEGKLRAEEFRRVFDGYIIQEISMPRLIDPSGLVDAGNDNNNIKARVGEYLITYGFDNSLGKTKPIIPHFYLTWSFPGMPDSRLKDARDVVRPPGGYEWYSLDPKVNTPDPGSQVESAHINSNDGETPESSINTASEKSKTQKKNQFLLWILGLVGVVFVTMILILRKRQFVDSKLD